MIKNDKCSTNERCRSGSQKRIRGRKNIRNAFKKLRTKEILVIVARETSDTAKFGDWQENMVSGRKSNV